MKGIKLLTLMGIVLLLVTNISAEENKKFTDQAELSYVKADGNTEVTTFSGKNVATYKFNKKVLSSWELGALYGESDGEKNAETYYTKLKTEYSFTDKIFMNVIAGWEKDEPSGLDNEYYIGPSAGYKILAGPKHHLKGEAGLDYVKEENTSGEDEDYTRGRVLAEYEYTVNDKTKLLQKAEYLYDFDNDENWNANSETAFITALNGSLSLKTSLEVKYDNEPAEVDGVEADETDTKVTVTLVINL